MYCLMLEKRKEVFTDFEGLNKELFSELSDSVSNVKVKNAHLNAN